MLVTCRSMAATVTVSSVAMPVFDRPCAISSMTARSRGVSSSIGLVALAPESGQIVGVARYIAIQGDPGAAEVAVAVDDDWQGHGIGRRLIADLAERARAEGITRVLAQVATENVTVIEWIRRSGGVVTARDGDAVLISIRLA